MLKKYQPKKKHTSDRQTVWYKHLYTHLHTHTEWADSSDAPTATAGWWCLTFVLAMQPGLSRFPLLGWAEGRKCWSEGGWGVAEGEKSAEHEHAHTQHKSITLSCSVFQNKAFHAIKSQDGLSFPLQTVEHFWSFHPFLPYMCVCVCACLTASNGPCESTPVYHDRWSCNGSSSCQHIYQKMAMFIHHLTLTTDSVVSTTA